MPVTMDELQAATRTIQQWVREAANYDEVEWTQFTLDTYVSLAATARMLETILHRRDFDVQPGGGAIGGWTASPPDEKSTGEQGDIRDQPKRP